MKSSEHHCDSRRSQICQRDHGFSSDGVEQMTQQHRAGEVAQRPHDEEQRHGARCDAVEVAQQRSEIERECVVDECLSDEQGEAQDRPPWVQSECDPGDFTERNGLSLADAQ
jgi:DNA-binding transcriptional MerR regulator